MKDKKLEAIVMKEDLTLREALKFLRENYFPELKNRFIFTKLMGDRRYLMRIYFLPDLPIYGYIIVNSEIIKQRNNGAMIGG